LRRLAATDIKEIVLLLNVNGQIPDRPDETVAQPFPVKHLTRLERFRQIKVDRANPFRHSTFAIRHSS
jgi:hypothetical protein